jgi:hypothetical protein
MLGGMGGQMRQTRQDKEQAQKMAGMTTEGLLAAQREAAATPAEAIAAGLAQEKFGRETAERKDAQRVKKQGQAEKLAGSKLSAMGLRHKALVKQGKQEEADKLLTQMDEIAQGAMVNLSDYVEDVVPEKKDDSSRYLNIGGGKVFDTKTATMIGGGEGKGKDGGVDPDKLADIVYKNKKAYTEESWEKYSNALVNDGVVEAAKLLEGVDVSKEIAGIRSAVVSDSNRNMSIIDDLLSKDINELSQATLWWVPASEEKTVDNAVKTLSANIAFDRLKRMRDNSKTGGALGAVSERELTLLEANLGSLDATSAEFKKNLRTIRRTYERIVDIETGPQGFDEEGTSLGSPNFVLRDNGEVAWVDPTTEIIYDYATGDPIEDL